MKEVIGISVGGTTYNGWISCAVAYNAKSPERTFQIVGAMGASAIEAALFDISPDDPCTVTATGDVLVTGWVDDLEIMMDAENREVRISGKSRGADLARNSVDHDTHEWKKQNVLQIAQSIDVTGIGLSSDEQMKVIDKVRANVGETQLQFIGRLAAKQRLFLTATEDGGVILTRHGKKRHAFGIEEGVNFLRGSVKRSSANRKNKVKVKGHRSKGSGAQSFRYEKVAQDPGARRGTVRVITPDQELSEEEAQEMGEHAVDNRFGDSVQLQCELVGFRDDDGRIWQPGFLVPCLVPSIRLNEDLAVNDVTLHQSDDGTLSKLVLVHPAALGGKGSGKGSKFNSKGAGTFRNRLESK